MKIENKYQKVLGIFILGLAVGSLVYLYNDDKDISDESDIDTDVELVDELFEEEINLLGETPIDAALKNDEVKTADISLDKGSSQDMLSKKIEIEGDLTSTPVNVNPDMEEAVDIVDEVEVGEETKEDENIKVSVTPAHQASLLAGMNTARKSKGVPRLTWSTSVAASAQAWADNLGSRGCILEHSTDNPYGENLYSLKYSKPQTLNPVAAVAWWVAEEAYYNYDSNTCAPGKMCGHYTQVVWKDTTTVGCGVTTCDGGNAQLWVCQYSPAGNSGTRPY